MSARSILAATTLLIIALLAPGALCADEKDNDIDRLQKKLQALDKQGTDLAAESRKLREKKEKLETDIGNSEQRVQKLEEECREATKALDKAKEQHREALKALDKVKDAEKTKAIKLEIEGLAKNIEALVKKSEALLKKNSDLLAANQRLQDEAKKIEEEYRAAKKKNEKLREEYLELVKSLENYKVGSGKPGITTNPPKDDVKGKVTAVDTETGTVTISIGKDAGLEKGHTLEVYRLKPKPTYLGTLVITEVKKDEATGKMKLRRGAVQVDDEVASDILSK